MAIGKYDQGGAINPPNGSENNDRAGDLHRQASFRVPKPEQANLTRFKKPSNMVCSRFPSAIFLGTFPDLAFQPRLIYDFFRGRWG